MSAVSTRVNNWPKANDTLCLIPLLDLANHEDLGVISTDYDDKSETFRCFAGREFEMNTEFKMFYGPRSSLDFLIHNGFIPNNYQYDAYLLELSLGTNTANCERKSAFLRNIGLANRVTFQLTPERLPYTRKLFAFINVFISTEGTFVVDFEVHCPLNKTTQILT